jgi:hypothetical protein
MSDQQEKERKQEIERRKQKFEKEQNREHMELQRQPLQQQQIQEQKGQNREHMLQRPSFVVPERQIFATMLTIESGRKPPRKICKFEPDCWNENPEHRELYIHPSNPEEFEKMSRVQQDSWSSQQAKKEEEKALKAHGPVSRQAYGPVSRQAYGPVSRQAYEHTSVPPSPWFNSMSSEQQPTLTKQVRELERKDGSEAFWQKKYIKYKTKYNNLKNKLI